MDIKEYLQDYATQRAIIGMFEDTKAAALDNLNSLPAKALYNTNSPSEYELAHTLQKTIKECEVRTQQARQKCEKIQAAIKAVADPRQRQILEMRYLQEPPETWEHIAEKLNHSFEYCHNLHRQALENIRI